MKFSAWPWRWSARQPICSAGRDSDEIGPMNLVGRHARGTEGIVNRTM